MRNATTAMASRPTSGRAHVRAADNVAAAAARSSRQRAAAAAVARSEVSSASSARRVVGVGWGPASEATSWPMRGSAALRKSSWTSTQRHQSNRSVLHHINCMQYARISDSVQTASLQQACHQQECNINFQ
jgi:hypothetical protein